MTTGRPMPAPKTYPKGAAQFDPTWYLMHETAPAFVGPFADDGAAEDYRQTHNLSTFVVVRMSKPMKNVTAPKDYVTEHHEGTLILKGEGSA